MAKILKSWTWYLEKQATRQILNLIYEKKDEVAKICFAYFLNTYLSHLM